MKFPARSEYSDYFATYISHVPTENPIDLLEKTQAFTLQVLEQVPADLYDHRYAEGKWTVKELLVHLLDCEQILAYRALRFARNDVASALPFSEDDYVSVLNAKAMDWDYIITATQLLRQHTIHLFKGFSETEAARGGSDAFPNTVQAIAAIIAGHQLHHIYVLQERYMKQNVQKFTF